ncbi:MAG TPA: ribonuclease P protein component [Candidatus Paceibacterota bacterium]|nr:ribonuclease P protein component [Candidatus Paceibacterota bacterium]
MLPKKKRVTKEAFRVLLKEGKTLSNQLFLFYHKKSPTPQYAFVAPKNLFKSSVKRNKFRRIGYNIMRFLDIKEGVGIFIYKKPAITAPQKEIKEEIVSLLKKASLLK